MSAHTPGPWSFSLSSGVVMSHADEFPDCRRPVICDLRRWPHEDTTYIHPANARLIASAPEMLAALRSARLALLMMLSYHGQGSADYADAAQHRAGEAIDEASAAIAKATGAEA